MTTLLDRPVTVTTDLQVIKDQPHVEDYVPGVTPVPPADPTLVRIPTQQTVDTAVDQLSSMMYCLAPECEKDGSSRHLQHLQVQAQIRSNQHHKKDLHDRRIRGIFAERRQHARNTLTKVDRRENIALLQDQLDELPPRMSIRFPVARLA